MARQVDAARSDGTTTEDATTHHPPFADIDLMDIDAAQPNKSNLYVLLGDMEYSTDVYQSLRVGEMSLSCIGGAYRCLSNEHEPTVADTRARIVRWVLETNISGKCCILPETVFLAVNIMDRFLSVQRTSLSEMPLAGAASLLLATKYEQGFDWNVKQYLFRTSANSRKEIVKAEKILWDALQGEMKVPTTFHFLVLLLKRCALSCSDQQMRKLERTAMSLAKTTLISISFVGTLPSIVACSCISLARLRTGLIAWDYQLMEFTGYHHSHFEFCIDILTPLTEYAGRPCVSPFRASTAAQIPVTHRQLKDLDMPDATPTSPDDAHLIMCRPQRSLISPSPLAPPATKIPVTHRQLLELDKPDATHPSHLPDYAHLIVRRPQRPLIPSPLASPAARIPVTHRQLLELDMPYATHPSRLPSADNARIHRPQWARIGRNELDMSAAAFPTRPPATQRPNNDHLVRHSSLGPTSSQLSMPHKQRTALDTHDSVQSAQPRAREEPDENLPGLKLPSPHVEWRRIYKNGFLLVFLLCLYLCPISVAICILSIWLAHIRYL